MTPRLLPRRLAGAVMALSLALAMPAARSDDRAEAERWIERMGTALERLNYEGTLVELAGEQATVMRVVHRHERGMTSERLTAIDGVGREIIRHGDEVTCILPDQRMVLVDRRDNVPGSTSRLRAQFGGRPHFPAEHYRLALEPGPVLAGRPTQVVVVEPADGLRYGYRLWLDGETALPLKVQVAGDGGAVVEQVLFADIRLGEPIADAAVRASQPTDGYTWRKVGPAPEDGAAPAPWTAGRLPPGFVQQAATTKPGRSAAPVTQLVYSDGVATVSVFIEPDAGSAGPAGPGAGSPAAVPGGTRLGSANLYTLVRSGHRVTAMGEVPARTVEMIARAMGPAPVADASTR
jgi:sigma-E factor negative regulatory protein RseB